MIYCVLAKFIFSMLGAYLSFVQFNKSPWASAFFIGVLPIWMEVLASYLTKVEPARETRLPIKIFDNIVDAITFIFIPTIWYSYFYGFDPSLLIFSLAGIWRLLKFIANGLVENYFVGLPVTYTGYVWPVLILLRSVPYHNVILIVLAWAMNSKYIKIKATHYEIT